MAKPRKLTTSRSERLFSGYCYSNGYGASSPGASELREEDIWAVENDGADQEEQNTTDSDHSDWSPRAVDDDDGRRLGPGDMRGADYHQVGGLSLAFQGSVSITTSPRIVHQYRGGWAGGVASPLAAQPRGGGSVHHMAASAPLNVPDWSKIYRVDSVESMHNLGDGIDDQELGSEMVPPHEYLCARSQKMAAASVFEGVGRTLKGRDMRRIRDAVWSQTGVDG